MTSFPIRRSRRAFAVAAAFALSLTAIPAAAQEKVDGATIERIKAEAMQRSQIMDIMSWMSDVYGPRLTWSPNEARAAKWAKIGRAHV